VREVPHSGTAEELLAKYKIDSNAIIEQVHAVRSTSPADVAQHSLSA
jgi:hypothetical protein